MFLRTSTLQILSRWFDGPEFLQLDQTQWPANKREKPDVETVNMESRKTSFAISTISNHLLEGGLYKISFHTRCISAVAWILRFADSSRNRKVVNTSSPSADELRLAMHCIAWNLQTKSFNEEFNLLQRGKHIRSN